MYIHIYWLFLGFSIVMICITAIATDHKFIRWSAIIAWILLCVVFAIGIIMSVA